MSVSVFVCVCGNRGDAVDKVRGFQRLASFFVWNCSVGRRKRHEDRDLSEHVPPGAVAMPGRRFLPPAARSVPQILRHLQSRSVHAGIAELL